MTQQHVLYRIKVVVVVVVEGESETERIEMDSGALFKTTFQAVLRLILTREPFKITDHCVNLLATDFLFQILAHPVFKM